MPLLTEDERIGTTLGERYTLEGILGRGGMGVVYDAEHTYTGRAVAVKLLRPGFGQDGERQQRLLREARAAAALDHEGIVDVLDMGEVDGCLYLVLERLEGRDLGAELAIRGRLHPREAVGLVATVLDALAVAHGAGIVHRDIKPSNIFLAQRGTTVVPKLLDFGIAKVQDLATMTAAGTIIGTPYYMSPEAAAGDDELGPAADVWSAAVVLYECLSGRRPFDGKTPTAVLMNVLREHATPLPVDGADAIMDVLMRALSKGPDRIRDAAELAAALRRAAGDTGTQPMQTAARPTSAAGPRGTALVAAAAIAVTIASAAVWATTAGSAPAPVEVAAMTNDAPAAGREGDETVLSTVDERDGEGRTHEQRPVASPRTALDMAASGASETRPPSPRRARPSEPPRAPTGDPTLVAVTCNGSVTRRPELQSGEWLRVDSLRSFTARGATHVPAALPRAVSRCYRGKPVGGWAWSLELDRGGVVTRAEPIRHCPVDERVVRCVHRAVVGTDIGEVHEAGGAHLSFAWSRQRPGPWGRAP